MAKGKEALKSATRRVEELTTQVQGLQAAMRAEQREVTWMRRRLRDQDRIVEEVERLRELNARNTSDELEVSTQERDRALQNQRRLEEALAHREESFKIVFNRLALELGGGAEAIEAWLSDQMGKKVSVAFHTDAKGPLAKAIETKRRKQARRSIHPSGRPR